MRRLSQAQARRVALAAQGLAAPRPPVTPNLGHVRRVVRSLGVVQIDSVNVVERAHHLTMFTRLGPHDPALLWRALEERRVFEYWGRMASFCPIEDFPLYRPRMDRNAESGWSRIRELQAEAPGYIESVYQQVLERGPLTASDLDDPGERTGPWWGWAEGKLVLEYLFAAGRLSVAHRRNFTRYYDIVERVIPDEYRSGPPPAAEEAERRLILHAAKALGVGTARDITGYFWLGASRGRRIIADLVADGSLGEAEVEGWGKPAYLDAEASIPRSVHARALVNPFDPFMWNRDRISRLHDFHYRIEIYVPRPKRVHGYYVFAFLLDDDLVARVDLKADRKAGVLRVPGAFLEDGTDDPARVTRELAVELHEMAAWLGLGNIAVERRGDLAAPLRRAV